MKRREFLQLALESAAVAALSPRARAEGKKEIRVEHQKNGVLVTACERATLEEHLLGLIPRQSAVRDVDRRNPQT